MGSAFYTNVYGASMMHHLWVSDHLNFSLLFAGADKSKSDTILATNLDKYPNMRFIYIVLARFFHILRYEKSGPVP